VVDGDEWECVRGFPIILSPAGESQREEGEEWWGGEATSGKPKQSR